MSELGTAWNVDPLIVFALVAIAVVYVRGFRSARRSGRPGLFWLGLAAIVVAIVSPLDALSEALASAHMVQHVLLIVVAPPLLVVSAPARVLLRGVPFSARRSGVRLGHALLRRVSAAASENPAAVALVHIVVVWVWHMPIVYDAAVGSHALHILEHVTFFFTALAAWWTVLHRSRRTEPRTSAVLVVFVLSLQSSLLSALLTFAPSAWYRSYVTTSSAWSLTPLADQQLAGVIMWVPAGAVYLGLALWMLGRWTTGPAERALEGRAVAPTVEVGAKPYSGSARDGESG